MQFYYFHYIPHAFLKTKKKLYIEYFNLQIYIYIYNKNYLVKGIVALTPFFC